MAFNYISTIFRSRCIIDSIIANVCTGSDSIEPCLIILWESNIEVYSVADIEKNKYDPIFSLKLAAKANKIGKILISSSPPQLLPDALIIISSEMDYSIITINALDKATVLFSGSLWPNNLDKSFKNFSTVSYKNPLLLISNFERLDSKEISTFTGQICFYPGIGRDVYVHGINVFREKNTITAVAEPIFLWSLFNANQTVLDMISLDALNVKKLFTVGFLIKDIARDNIFLLVYAFDFKQSLSRKKNISSLIWEIQFKTNHKIYKILPIENSGALMIFRENCIE